jgi:hypothetical protein
MPPPVLEIFEKIYETILHLKGNRIAAVQVEQGWQLQGGLIK